ncbi:transmembrane protein, putative (macronuclear) [Tetrahymena thermophila SB210]|uniref:Transmembrane protein, putative n=1 Tax=Tetrahymena thermophila (strain SB210) TaxID=312017 RepID=I7M014_TETTS|nr:transmembrane protein, putative [Tetrahymena thermophila SB210]EAR85297.2 transmembrane protein, putative [Tetrahymena thermophila SB210]|eukprot:XP_001032960.2 transmembrane protein, putative [Tetrahymena thermophila SB210]
MSSEKESKQNQEETLDQENQQLNIQQNQAQSNEHIQLPETNIEQHVNENSLKFIRDQEEEEEKNSSKNYNINLDKNSSNQDKSKDQDYQDFNEVDYEDLDVDEEERKENSSTQNSINQEGPSIKTIPSLFPNTNIMHIRDQNQGYEFNKPFEDINELINQLKTKQKFQKWSHDFEEIIQQLNQSKRLLTDLQQPTQDRTLRESNLDYVLEQLTIIRSQFDEVSYETNNLPDEGDIDKNNLTSIDELLNKITQIVIKYQQQRINQMNTFLASAPINNPLNQNMSNQQQQQPGQSNSQNNNGNINRVQNNIANQSSNVQNNNQNNIPNNNNNQNLINQQQQQQQGQRQNIGQQQDIRVVRTYSMSLDLQIFQQMVDGFQKMINHFDIILKSLIILSSAFMMISFYSIQQQLILKPCDDQFVTFMKWLINQVTISGANSKVFVLNAIILSSFSIIFFWRQLWKVKVGPFTHEQKVRVKENLFRFCIFKHLILMKILDERIWSCSFDIFVICVIYMQADISRFFSEIIELTIKSILSSMSEEYEQEIKKIQSIKKFNTLLTLFNLSTLIICLIVFSSIPKLVLLRLLFGLGTFFIKLSFIFNLISKFGGLCLSSTISSLASLKLFEKLLKLFKAKETRLISKRIQMRYFLNQKLMKITKMIFVPSATISCQLVEGLKIVHMLSI